MKVSRIKCAVIGSGNIGTDLLYKLRRSEVLEPVCMAGIEANSVGLARARDMGLKVTDRGVAGLAEHVEAEGIRIAFDATSAHSHGENARRMNELGVLMIDLTPAAIGPYCVPSVNLSEMSSRTVMNVNMVTCGGQATIPIVHAVSRVQAVDYAEIVATVASRSVGPGTRKNIDEFTRTTAAAVAKIGGAQKGKALNVINPAEPPLIMRDTVFCETRDDPDEQAIGRSVRAIVAEVQKYVPGYRLKNGPIFDDRKVSVFLEVEGLGDFLPKYAGNLDIMTAAAVHTAEVLARKFRDGERHRAAEVGSEEA
jgi:acetaldehyde/propanal dehydrogenase